MAARRLIRVRVEFMPSESELGDEGVDDAEGGEQGDYGRAAEDSMCVLIGRH